MGTYTDGNGYRLTVEFDEDVESPRRWDNLGHMVCWHQRYVLGDERRPASLMDTLQEWAGENYDDETEEMTEMEAAEFLADKVEFLADKVRENAVLIPLYLDDHSGLRMSTSPFHDPCGSGFVDPWGSGFVGFLYASMEDTRHWLGECGKTDTLEEVRKKGEEILQGEADVYDQYLSGDVYWFKLEKVKECENCQQEVVEHIDSCGGFFGHDHRANRMADALGKFAYLLDEID